jgi:hypothetical protein
MERAPQRVRSVGVLFALGGAVLFSLSGCALLGPEPEPVAVIEANVPGPVVSMPAEPAPEPVVAPPVEPPPTVIEPPVEAPRATVGVLYSGSASTQLAIADLIESGLASSDWTVHRIDLDRLHLATPVETSIEWSVSMIAAIGPDALATARQRFPGADIVFCQVLDAGVSGDAVGTQTIRAVAAMPPLELQFSAWASLDPKLEHIGLITSAGFAAELADAVAAAEAIGARLDHRISNSDRETLYIFRRLAPGIDGLWLAPDSTVLSGAVIGEILDLAAELDLGVLVFNEGLLARGGLLSVLAPEEHVAALVVDALGAFRSRSDATLPREIALSEGVVRVNTAVAAALGLPPPPSPEWVIRD